MGYGVSKGKRASPAATENMHFAGDLQLPTQFQHVIAACARCALSAATLVKENDPISRRIEKAGEGTMTSSSRAAMHEHDRLAVSRAVFFPVNPVLRIPVS